jgi:hypothetical protein
MAGSDGIWHDELMAKRPRDPNQLAKLILDIATGEVADDMKAEPKRGRAGGLRGGKVRAKRLTPKRRAEIAKLAAEARWKKSN